MTMPSLFISHGSPLIAIVDTPVGCFLGDLGQEIPAPRAILCISAHWETWFTAVTGSPAPPVIHDFRGPRALHELTYSAPGDPPLAATISETLAAEGMATTVDPQRGLDHGAWIALRFMAPSATVPVLQLSLRTDQDSRFLFQMGRALRPLRDEGVLILASGGAVHNLYEIDGRPMDAPPEAFVRDFDNWLHDAVAGNRTGDLMDWQNTAPDPQRSHPMPAEHFLPLFVALGAGSGSPGRLIHKSFMHGTLSMAAYLWD
jgi:4,5-DOPA dioxygenase extradiol